MDKKYKFTSQLGMPSSYYWHRPHEVKSVSKWKKRGVKNPPSEEFLLSQGDCTRVKMTLKLEKYICNGRCANKNSKGVNVTALLEISAMFIWLKKWILKRVGQGLSLKYGGEKAG